MAHNTQSILMLIAAKSTMALGEWLYEFYHLFEASKPVLINGEIFRSIKRAWKVLADIDDAPARDHVENVLIKYSLAPLAPNAELKDLIERLTPSSNRYLSRILRELVGPIIRWTKKDLLAKVQQTPEIPKQIFLVARLAIVAQRATKRQAYTKKIPSGRMFSIAFQAYTENKWKKLTETQLEQVVLHSCQRLAAGQKEQVCYLWSRMYYALTMRACAKPYVSMHGICVCAYMQLATERMRI